MRIRRALGSLLASTALAGATVVALPAPAEAALRCGGTGISTLLVTSDSGTVIGRVGVYRKGTNICAVTVRAGHQYGKAGWTNVVITGSAGKQRVSDGNDGYKYQTDAVTMNAATARDGCIWLYGQVNRFSSRVLHYCV